MTYWELNAIFLAVVALVALVGIVVGRTPAWAVVGLVAVLLLVTTAIFDNVMISVGLVAYDPGLIQGAFVGVAPVEDFAYPLAAAVGLPALWVLLAPSKSKRRRA
jgi:lycopene cyclase domain-containing protein